MVLSQRICPTLQDLNTYLQTNKRIHVKPHTQTYSTKEQLKFIFPKQSYGLCSELNDEDLEEFTGFENI